MVNAKLPSYIENNGKSLISQSGLNVGAMQVWYLGVDERNPHIKELIANFGDLKQFSLIKDKQLSEKYKSYLDVSNIPNEYKKGKSYYEEHNKLKDSMYSKSKLENTDILLRNSELNALVKKLFNRDISPLLADKKYLVGLPKAYFVIVEWDDLKDEGILYAERMKEANVTVKIAFYEKAFHGISNLVDKYMGFQGARDIQKDLIDYLKNNL